MKSIPDPAHYNKLYKEGYMSGFTDIYEYCRVKTVMSMLNHLKTKNPPKRILDIGCGQGRYITISKNFFNDSEFIGVDFSEVALAKAKENHPDTQFFLGTAEDLHMIPEESIDLIISIELFEHVYDFRKTIRECSKVLKPSGRILFTTPCANKFSLEWLENYLSKQIKRTDDGYNLFGTDPYEHLRRLTSNDVKTTFSECGLTIDQIRYRAHLFTRISYRSSQALNRRFNKNIAPKFFAEMAFLDWRLFRLLPNGATMIGVARRSV